MGDLSKNFSRHEWNCNCSDLHCPGKDPTVDAKLVEVLQTLRDHAGASVTINSGYRCAVYNARIGGAPNSKHLTGRAADIVVANMTPDQVADFFAGTEIGGLGRYNNFTHVDTRVLPNGGFARWDKRT